MTEAKDDIIFLGKALQHVLKEMDKVCKNLEKSVKTHEEKNALFKKKKDLNIYDKKEPLSKQFWALHEKAETYKNKAFNRFTSLVSFAIELNNMYKGKKNEVLYHSIFGNKFKEVAIKVMWVSYPRNWFGFTKYCFKGFAGMEWLGFEWIYGYTSKVGGKRNNPNYEHSGWYHNGEYYCY
jgi:hypothetical protein